MSAYKQVGWMALALVLRFGGVGAGDISYIGPGRGPGSALVREADGHVRELSPGETVADLGELLKVTDDEVVFERRLRPDERDTLRELGLTVPDLQRLHVPRRPQTPRPAETAPGSEAAW